MIQVFDKAGACNFLHITLENLENQIEAGKLPFHRIGEQIVFTEKDVMALLNKSENSSSAIGSAKLSGV